MEPIVWFKVAGATVYAYQALLAVGVPLCWALGALRAKRRGLLAAALWFIPLSAVLGPFLAHLCFGLLRMGDVSGYGAGYLLRFWESDGLHAYMLYGGALGCVLAACLAARLAKANARRLMDALAPAGALMLALARAAQGLAGQGHGRMLDEESPFAFFPLAVYDDLYEMWSWAVFVPAALYLLVVAVALWRRGEPARAGDDALLLLLLYAGAQITFESLRMDDVLRWGFVRCSQVVSAVAAALALGLYARRAPRGWRPLAGWAAYLALLGVCLLMEFAIEKRVAFLEFLEPAGCHAVMVAASALVIADGLWMRGLSRPQN